MGTSITTTGITFPDGTTQTTKAVTATGTLLRITRYATAGSGTWTKPADTNSALFRMNGGTGVRRVGVIAQEVQKVLPEVVGEDAEGYLTVAYANMVGVLIEAVKTLSARIDELEACHD